MNLSIILGIVNSAFVHLFSVVFLFLFFFKGLKVIELSVLSMIVFNAAKVIISSEKQSFHSDFHRPVFSKKKSRLF